MDWQTEAKIHDIEKSLRTARDMQQVYTQRVDELETMLRQLKPPFTEGQEVTPVVGRGRGRHATVQAIEKAFGDWVVQVKFRFEDRIYTYMARDLKAVETGDEVPF